MRFLLVKRRACMAVGVGLLAVLLVVAVWSKVGARCPSNADRIPVLQPETGTGEIDLPDDSDRSQVAAPVGADPGMHAKDYYVECRLEKERSRGKQIELLRSIVGDPQAGAQARQNAQDRLLQISLELDHEVSVENILRAKGLDEVVVFFQNEMLTVVIPHPATPEQSATVVNLAARATGMGPENILVIARDD